MMIVMVMVMLKLAPAEADARSKPSGATPLLLYDLPAGSGALLCAGWPTYCGEDQFEGRAAACLWSGYFFLATFFPFLRTSESPMAIACFLLVTFFPLRPLRSVPSLRLCIADLTSFDALFDVLRGAITGSLNSA